MNNGHWNLDKIFLFFRKNKSYIIISVILFLIFGFFYAQLLKPNYVAVQTITMPGFFNDKQQRTPLIYDVDEFIKVAQFFAPNTEILRLAGSYEFVELRGYGETPGAAEKNLNVLFKYIIESEKLLLGSAIKSAGFTQQVEIAVSSLQSLRVKTLKLPEGIEKTKLLAEVDFNLAQLDITASRYSAIKDIELSKVIRGPHTALNAVTIKKIKFILLSALFGFLIAVVVLILMENIKTLKKSTKENRDALYK